jgi:hypothetical protein
MLKELDQIMTNCISSDENNLFSHADENFHRLTNITLAN